MGWLQLVGSILLQVSFAKEPYNRDYILQKRPVILSILLTVATPSIYIRQKPYLSVTEPDISVKEPYISAKEPGTSANEFYTSAKKFS